MWHGSKVTLIKRGKELRFQHDGYTEAVNEHEILLDFRAWQAVGKVKGWGEVDGVYIHEQESWRQIRRRFFQLTEDKSTEEALGEILK